MKIDLNKIGPPECTNCHKPVFRPGHVAKFMAQFGEPGFRTFTVCMHCSAIWAVTLVGEKVELHGLTPEDDKVASALEFAAKSFRHSRETAERLGIPFEEYVELMDALRGAFRSEAIAN